jgi:YVTN family beta-propeller protein
MKKQMITLGLMVGVMAMFSSCQKDDAKISTTPVNYDAAYVVNGQSNSISVIDLSSNQVKQTIDLSGFTASASNGMMGGGMGMNMSNMWPYHINISPDKSKLVIAAPGTDFSGNPNMGMMSGTQGKLLILDAVTGDLLKAIQLDGMAHNAIYSPDGKELWTALMMTGGKVMVYDANTYALLNTIPVGQMPAEVTFSDDGTKAFVANGMSGSVTVIDAATKKVIDTIITGTEPSGAWPGMGGMMYVDNVDGQSISIFDTMNDMMKETIQLGFMPGMVVRNTMMNQMWVSDPDGSKIQYWTINGSSYMIGGAINVGSGAHAMAFSKDGKMAYVTNQNDGTVSVVDIPGKKEMMKIKVGNKPNGIVIRFK